MSDEKKKSDPAREVAETIDNPAGSTLDTLEELEEEVKEVVSETDPEPVTEIVEPAEPEVNPVMEGINKLGERMDGIEESIKGLVSPPAPGVITEVKEDDETATGMETEEPAPPADRGGDRKKKGRRLRILRGTRGK